MESTTGEATRDFPCFFSAMGFAALGRTSLMGFAALNPSYGANAALRPQGEWKPHQGVIHGGN